MKNITKPVWAVVGGICGEKLQAVRPTRALAREWNHEHNYGLGSIVKYIPAPVTPKAKPAPKAVSVLTDWISCDTPPVRVGVYERNDRNGLEKFGTVFQYWNGVCWGFYWGEPNKASPSDNRSGHQSGIWRGFTTPQP
jgi:hypothetical protein